MSYDTAKDPRLLVAHRACALLSHSVQQKLRVRLSVGREQLTAWIAAADSAVMTLTYTYLEPQQLAGSEPMTQVTSSTDSLTGALAPLTGGDEAPPLLRATVRWSLRTLAGLPRRMTNPGTTLASGVDMAAVQVRNVVRSGNLWLTRVSDGATELPVMTNLEGVRHDDVLAAAFLPPREVGGVVSEAMFLGADARQEPPGTPLTEDQVDAREAASILHDEIARR